MSRRDSTEIEVSLIGVARSNCFELLSIEGFLSLMSATSSNPAIRSPNFLAKAPHLFLPPWLFRNGHVQTLAGTYVFGRWKSRYRLPIETESIRHVTLADGDQLAYHDDCPPDWQPGDPVALILHGLAGSHESPYMLRLARRFYQQNVRSIRLNWRGCGTGISLARYPYHSGRSDDLQAVIQSIQTLCPDSPLSVIGFSMGGNVILKLLGEAGGNSAGNAGICRAVAVCPPIDLTTTIDHISNGLASAYNSYFAKTCVNNIRSRQQVRPDAIVPDDWFSRPPRSMREFDETFTAPVCGFSSAADYYTRCSANQFLPTIAVPTLIIAAQDDPVIPFAPFTKAVLSSWTQLRAPRHGGHVGFVTHAGPGWLDQQILNWTLGDA
jgi:predicted alpha/beta-fold hydrolase